MVCQPLVLLFLEQNIVLVVVEGWVIHEDGGEH